MSARGAARRALTSCAIVVPVDLSEIALTGVHHTEVIAGYRSQSRGRVRLPAAQRPPSGLLQPHAPLDRTQHPRPHLHLRTRPPARPPHAPPRPPGRPGPVGTRPAQRTRRDQRDRPDLPLHRRQAQGPPHDDRPHRSPAAATSDFRPEPLGTKQLDHRPKGRERRSSPAETPTRSTYPGNSVRARGTARTGRALFLEGTAPRWPRAARLLSRGLRSMRRPPGSPSLNSLSACADKKAHVSVG